MMIEDDKMVIIDFDRYDFGDPWEEFNRIVWSAQASPIFASGIINGYFDNEVPHEFWKLLALYIGSNMLSSIPWAIPFGEGEVHTMLKLIHICLHQKYPCIKNMSYIDELNYIAFDKSFAHALSYSEDIFSFQLDEFLHEKYNAAKEKLKQAITETNPLKMEQYRISADTGDYWDKFASISGKLYLLQHLDNLFELYQSGWRDFSIKILG